MISKVKYYFSVFKSWSFDKKAVFIAGMACALSFAIIYIGRLAI